MASASSSEIKIVDITVDSGYEKYLCRCLGGPPSKHYRKRIEYLEQAIPKGFHKKLLIFNEEVVGTIEYAPSEVSYYPISGGNIIVMNCIWVLRRAKGYDFGKSLTRNMVQSEKHASGFATIALENHWSPWFKKWQMEKLGFNPQESIDVSHKAKLKEKTFSIYLMWMPNKPNTKQPSWNQQKLLEGITFCIAHPLYHPQTYKPNQILEKN
jgi:hypothetical protein